MRAESACVCTKCSVACSKRTDIPNYEPVKVTRSKMRKPPEGLVLLSSLPKAMWLGRTVYHPMTQMGSTPYWREADLPEGSPARDPDAEDPQEYYYDIGEVDSWDENDEVTFHFWHDRESTLHYHASNLWCKPMIQAEPVAPPYAKHLRLVPPLRE